LLEQIKELYSAYDKLNKMKFEGKLGIPIITIQSQKILKKKVNVFGWFSKESWSYKETINFVITKEIVYHEINIVAEYLNRPYEEIVETLLHEMVHQYNFENNIMDCKKNYHNKMFKSEAERVGLIVEKIKIYGYGITRLSDELRKEILTWNDFNNNIFNINRNSIENKKASKPVIKKFKFVCNNCGKVILCEDEEIEAECVKCKNIFRRVL
jgi:hypothetical protein